MRFNGGITKEGFHILMGDPEVEQDTVELIERYLKNRNAYIKRIKHHRNVGKTKHAWRKYRFKYEAGIHRYWRSPARQALRRKVARGVRKSLFRADSRSLKSEAVQVKVEEYTNFEFVGALAELKSHLCELASTFDMENEYVDMAAFTHEACCAISRIEQSVLEEGIMEFSDAELVLALVRDHVFQESSLTEKQFPNGHGYVDLFFERVSIRKKETSHVKDS